MYQTIGIIKTIVLALEIKLGTFFSGVIIPLTFEESTLITYLGVACFYDAILHQIILTCKPKLD